MEMGGTMVTDGSRGGESPDPRRKLPRAERREQILTAATEVFAEKGPEGTGLADIARAAGISRMILYRHFASKVDLYRGVVERAGTRLAATTGAELSETSVRDLVRWAAEEPAAFRILFGRSAAETEFRRAGEELRTEMGAAVHDELAAAIPHPLWAAWAARLSLTVAIEAIRTWLDVGRPDPDEAPGRIEHTVWAVIAAGRER
jgi:AcrR family transcriptional regulator